MQGKITTVCANTGLQNGKNFKYIYMVPKKIKLFLPKPLGTDKCVLR